MQLEIFLQTLHFYFANSPKKHLQFTKLVEFMETKENKILQNVKTRWILMFNLTKCSTLLNVLCWSKWPCIAQQTNKPN
jgi:hypothetical protein